MTKRLSKHDARVPEVPPRLTIHELFELGQQNLDDLVAYCHELQKSLDEVEQLKKERDN